MAIAVLLGTITGQPSTYTQSSLLGGPISESSRPLPGPCARVFVYALNVARLAGNMEAIEREITLALEREITATFLEAEQAERPEKELN